MSINFKLFLKRFLIFQFAFLFIFSKIIKLEKSIKDLSKRLKYIAKNSQYSEETLKSIELKSPKIFMIIYSTYFLFSFLALMNIGLAKQLTGIMTIFMALIYCNPLSTIKKNMEKNNYQEDWKIYIPSLEFCIISCLGFAMILSAFYFINEDNKDDTNQQQEKKEENKEKKKDEKKEEQKEEQKEEVKEINIIREVRNDDDDEDEDKEEIVLEKAKAE
jgi:hypothetical protein